MYGIGTFDPALSRDLDTNLFNRQVHRGLLQFDASLQPTPAVAETFEALDGGRRYRFSIRPGLTFSNGAPVDAYAVATSLSRSMHPSVTGGDPSLLAAPTYLGDIEGADDVLNGRLHRMPGIQAESDRTLTISLTERSGTFPMRLCSVPASIVDANDVRTVDGVPVGPAGVGPYELVSISSDGTVRLEASASWFGEPPDVTAIEFRTGANAANPFNLFQAGEIDLIPSLGRQLAPLATDPAMDLDGELISTPLFALAYIALGTAAPPLDDIHVRRALTMAFPTHRIATDSFQGRVASARGVIPQGMLGHDWPDAMQAYDPEAARAELASSTYADRQSIPQVEIFATDVEPLSAFRDVIERELGIAIHVYDVAWGDLLDGLSRKTFNAYSLYWGADYPDPESLLWMLFGADSADNYIGYENDRFEDAIRRAREEVDDRTRIVRYGEAERLLLDDGVCLPLYQDIGHTLVRRGVDRVRPTQMGLLGLESVRFTEG